MSQQIDLKGYSATPTVNKKIKRSRKSPIFYKAQFLNPAMKGYLMFLIQLQKFLSLATAVITNGLKCPKFGVLALMQLIKDHLCWVDPSVVE
ncbi:hypothetical protein L2E82_10731 [Cichorium intybus]|uniref:Uncharacterized protein n=1 Tax=Cichorium intybus TaxID=13427 RepID=A0ACB9GB82_CICIN|nr:hypothetical protein L2E82_10731 [Cichorium intybus]